MLRGCSPWTPGTYYCCLLTASSPTWNLWKRTGDTPPWPYNEGYLHVWREHEGPINSSTSSRSQVSESGEGFQGPIHTPWPGTLWFITLTNDCLPWEPSWLCEAATWILALYSQVQEWLQGQEGSCQIHLIPTCITIKFQATIVYKSKIY